MEKYFIVYDFMINDLKLKGSDLLVYAYLFSGCSEADNKVVVSQNKLSKHLGITRASVQKALNVLIDRELITKEIVTICFQKYGSYSINYNLLNK